MLYSLLIFLTETNYHISKSMLLSDYNTYTLYLLIDQRTIDLVPEKSKKVTSVLLQCLFWKLCVFSNCIHQVEALMTW